MPAPTRSSASTYLGPIIGKRNYDKLPPSNQQTDFDNTKRTYAYCDVAAHSQTVDQIVFNFTPNTTTGTVVLNNYWSQWIVVTPQLPTIVRTTTGVFTFSFPTLVSNEYDLNAYQIANNVAVNLSGGVGGFSSVAGFVAVGAVGNIVTVSLFSTGGGASDMAGHLVSVKVF